MRAVFRFAAGLEVFRDFDAFFDFELLPRVDFAALVRLFALRPLAGRPFILLSMRQTCASNVSRSRMFHYATRANAKPNKVRVRKRCSSSRLRLQPDDGGERRQFLVFAPRRSKLLAQRCNAVAHFVFA